MPEPTTDAVTGPADRLSRRFLLLVAAAALIAAFAQAPGRLAADTKLDLTANPLGFLRRAMHLWSPTAPMGQVQNQAYGYFFPHGAFYALGEVLHLPPWVTQRLWWALLLFIGFSGLVALARALRVGSPASQLIAASVFVLSPRVLTTLGSISSETLPMMLAPWVLVPVVRALDDPGGRTGPVWRPALRSAAAIAAMGAVNAVATVAACLVAVLWFAMSPVDRRWLRFGCWWIAGALLACAWWVVPLLILSRVSPSFLDFIESSRVTTEWTSLTEVARGTSSWTPFVSPERVAGSILVTQPAAVIATGVLAAAGVAGLSMRGMPFRRRLIAIAAVGFALMCVGYAGQLGSPLAEQVRAFLDGAGAPLRNVHKIEPLIRIPAVLGIAHLLARAPLPGTVTVRQSLSALAHPQRSRPAAAAIVVLVALIGAGSVAWTGGLGGTDTYREMPGYWKQTAAWLDAHAGEQHPDHPARALVVPGAPFATQLWGLTRDEPLQPLATTPWAVRDAIPLVPPTAIRAMDSVQRMIADGRPSPGLAATLAQQGIGYVVLRADLTPNDSRSARPLVAAQALDGSPGLRRVARFGPDIGPATVRGVVVDDGLRPKMTAITIYAVDAGARFPGTGPVLTDLASMPRVSGGPEALAALQDYATRTGRPALGPALLSADARRAGLAAGPLTVTDTPVARETDFGRVDDHSSSARAPTDPRRTKNSVADYPVEGQPVVHGQWLLDNTAGQVRVSASGSASDATQPGQTSPADSPAAAFDHNQDTSWISSGLDSAVGQWLQINFTRPQSNLALTLATRKALGPDVTGVVVATDNGTAAVQGLRPDEPQTVTLPGGPTSSIRITATRAKGGVAGNQFALGEVSLTDLVTGRPLDLRFRPTLPDLPPGTAVDRWLLTQELDTRSACVRESGQVRCSPALGRAPETPGVFSRMLSVPAATSVDASVVLRPQPGQDLNAVLHSVGGITASGAAATSDPRGNAMALIDGDPATTWTEPESSDAKHRPEITLELPRPQRVDSLRLTLPDGYPARPTEVTVDTGAGPRRHQVGGDGLIKLDGAQTSRIVLVVTKKSDLIDVNGLGFARPAPVGISEIAVNPAPTAALDPDRPITIGCDRGMGITAAGQVVGLQVSTTARALRNGEPVVAHSCGDERLELPAGRQEVSVNPTGLFTVATVNLSAVNLSSADPGSPTPPLGRATTTAPATPRWGPEHRSVTVEPSSQARALVVPESTNVGWHASLDGVDLDPVVVNGWQQGWVVPAGAQGTIDLTYRFDSLYRWSLAVGLALVAVLLCAAFWPVRWSGGGREVAVEDQARSPSARLVPPVVAAVGVCAAGWLLSGWWGLGVAAVTGVATAWLTRRQRRGAVVVIVFVAMLAAALGLAAGPWHSQTGYHGFAWWVQLPALISVLTMLWSAVEFLTPFGLVRSRRRSQSRQGSSTKA